MATIAGTGRAAAGCLADWLAPADRSTVVRHGSFVDRFLLRSCADDVRVIILYPIDPAMARGFSGFLQ